MNGQPAKTRTAGAVVNALRLERGWSLGELALRAFRYRSDVMRYCNGTYPVSEAAAAAFSRVFGVEVAPDVPLRVCKRGHALSEGAVRIRANGWRRCLACERAGKARRRAA